MKDIIVDHKETHFKEDMIFLDKEQLQCIIIAGLVQQKLISNLPREGTFEVKIVFEDQTEGSPPYTVGTKARVVIKETLS